MELFGLGARIDPKENPNTVYVQKDKRLHECRRYRIASYIEDDVQERMERAIRKIPRVQRKSLSIHFVVNQQKTITAINVFNVNGAYQHQLKKDLQWIMDYQIPYPKSCGYDIVMKLDFSALY